MCGLLTFSWFIFPTSAIVKNQLQRSSRFECSGVRQRPLSIIVPRIDHLVEPDLGAANVIITFESITVPYMGLNLTKPFDERYFESFVERWVPSSICVGTSAVFLTGVLNNHVGILSTKPLLVAQVGTSHHIQV